MSFQGLVAMDNDDVTVVVVMNGVNVFGGKPEHSMKHFIQAKRRQREKEDNDGRRSSPKHPRLSDKGVDESSSE